MASERTDADDRVGDLPTEAWPAAALAGAGRPGEEAEERPWGAAAGPVGQRSPSWDGGSQTRIDPWEHEEDTDDDPVTNATGTDPQETVSPDDPAWTYAGTAVIDEEVADEAVASTDWLDRICPYLLSEDGTSRSSQPDERHRCTAQDPPATLPLAFQERFCLTERHVRCEMYKVAEDARTQAFAEDSIPAEQVRSARFRPTVRSRPVTLEPSTQVSVADPPEPSGPNRQVLIALAAAGGFALMLLVIALLLGGGGGTPDGASPAPDGGAAATLGPDRTLAPQATLGGGPVATQAPPDLGPPTLIRYELQTGERLIRVAEVFGTSRAAIRRVNEGREPDVLDAREGDIIVVPVSPTMAEAEIQALPGFVEFVEPAAP